MKISLDGGSLTNIDSGGSLPTVTPAAGKLVKVTVAATQMDANNVNIIFSDAAGAEWCDLHINIQPVGVTIPGAVNDASSTTTHFITTLTGFGDDHFIGSYMVFTDGSLQGIGRKIATYTSTTGNFTFGTAYPQAPGASDPFIIIGRSE